MPVADGKSALTIALIGNPNTGKSTLFGDLVGIHQHVGNYPGVTVEKKTGRMELGGRRYEVIDLPGLYSLAARSRDEMVAVDVLLGRREDVPPRRCRGVHRRRRATWSGTSTSASQVLELGLPTVLAVNMLDVAASRGITLHLERLERRLGVPVVPIQANRGIGLDRLMTALVEVWLPGPRHTPPLFPEPFEREADELEKALLPPAPSGRRPLRGARG